MTTNKDMQMANQPLSLDAYQIAASIFARYHLNEVAPTMTVGDGPDLNMVYLYPFLALTEEAGEVSGKLAKIARDGHQPENVLALQYELGDVLWQLSQCCKELGLTLSEVAQLNIDKLTDRANRGKLQGSGDHR